MTNLPVTGNFKISAIYGQTGDLWKEYHKGIDFVSDNKNVYCTCEGTVRVVEYDAGGWGNYISVGDATGRRHIFCHLKSGSISVSVGQKVDRTTILGVMGQTGNASGVHLHYQLNGADNNPTDPTLYLGIPNKIGAYNSADYAIDDKTNMVFKDNKNISSWSKNAVLRVAKEGIMVGDEKGNFNPKANLTREEAAVIISRILDRKE